MNDKDYQEIVNKMQKYMDDNLLSMEAFSKEVQVSYNSIQKWTHGKRQPNRQSLLKLKRFFQDKEAENDTPTKPLTDNKPGIPEKEFDQYFSDPASLGETSDAYVQLLDKIEELETLVKFSGDTDWAGLKDDIDGLIDRYNLPRVQK